MRAVIAQPLPDREAEFAAQALARFGEVRAVCVIGSSARGECEDGSDIDLLALVEDRAAAVAVRAAFGLERGGRRVQLRLLSETRLGRLFEQRSTFAVHILRESVVVYDPLDRFAALSEPHSRDDPVRDDGVKLRIRLEPYEDLEWCQGLYLYCLSDLYSIGRAAAYTILGRESRFEFSGARALRAIARHHPSLAQAAWRVAALRPFFLLVERNTVGPLPFAYRDCHQEALDARDASRALVEAIQ